MKRRSLIVLVVVALFAGAVWWWQSLGPTSEKAAPAPIASAAPKAMSPAPKVGTVEIAKPTVVPTPAPTPAEATPTPNEAKAEADPQKEINTMLSGAIDQIQNGNLENVFETFVSPDRLAQIGPDAKISLEEALQTWQGKPEIQIWMQVLQSMKGQTPIYNGAGDEATYAISDPTGRGIALRPITLHKINGQWYFTPTDILRGGAGFGLAQNPPVGI